MIDDWQHPHHRRDKLKQLRAFCQAARLGSISRAAEQVMSSQPSVSLQVRTLEEELGTRLFERRGPRISLTWAGESLYRMAMPLVAGMDRLPDIFAEQHHGVFSDLLRIGAGQTSASYLLPEYLKRFREEHPKVRIEVKIGSGQERMKWLRGYELDLVVAAMDDVPLDVEFRALVQSVFVLITPEDHPLAGRDTATAEEIAAHPFITHTSTGYVGQLVAVLMRMHGIVPKVVIEVDGWDVITSYVAAGVGISFVPDLCLSGREPVSEVPFRHAAPPRRYGAITRRAGPLSPAASQCLRIMTAERLEASGGS